MVSKRTVSATLSPLSKQPRGRPRDLAKRALLVTTATRLFTEHGAAGVTMDRLSAEAGVAKSTLYLHFKDKDGILEAVARHESERLLSDDFQAEHCGMDLVDVLIDIGIRLLVATTAPDQRGFQRLTFDLATSHPHLAQRMFVAGPKRIMDLLRDVLANGVAQHRIVAPDLNIAADALVGLWEGFYRIEVDAGMRSRPDLAEIDKRSRRGVAFFMQLFGTQTT